jgi:DNA replication protein DnaC
VTKNNPETLSALRDRARYLGLHGVLANWDSVAAQSWLPTLIEFEEVERSRRSMQRRLRSAKLPKFKPMADFDWTWPKVIDREAIEELFSLSFIQENANVVLVGGNGLGKTMIAMNLLHTAVVNGYTACAISASELLNNLAAQESSAALLRRLRHYSRPQLLFIDELGYLAASHEHADLLFELVNRRYLRKSTILTTNKVFSEWNSVFPNAGCLVTLIDRIIHKSEILTIDGESYRAKEASERAAQKQALRKKKHAPKK